MIPRVRLSNKDIYDYEVRVIRIFKDCKDAVKSDDRLYDYRVKDYQFKIDHSDLSFTVFYKKDYDKKEHNFSCNNEDNVVERVAALVKKITIKS